MWPASTGVFSPQYAGKTLGTRLTFIMFIIIIIIHACLQWMPSDDKDDDEH
jgi:carbon starvation protein CstA